jgi:hypothetical protein
MEDGGLTDADSYAVDSVTDIGLPNLHSTMPLRADCPFLELTPHFIHFLATLRSCHGVPIYTIYDLISF